MRIWEVEDLRQKEQQLQRALRPFTASSCLSQSVTAGVEKAAPEVSQTLGPAWTAAALGFRRALWEGSAGLARRCLSSRLLRGLKAVPVFPSSTSPRKAASTLWPSWFIITQLWPTGSSPLSITQPPSATSPPSTACPPTTTSGRWSARTSP